MKGVFSLMLHSHIPYCRKSGVWPAGEEWLFEAMNETYIPILSVLRRFQMRNLKPRIMMGIVPILAEQLADPYMNGRFCEYMEDKISRAEKDLIRFKGNQEKSIVAEYWLNKFNENYKIYKKDFFGDIMGTFKWLKDEKTIDILTSAATHGFLPLMESDSGIYSQIEVGIRTYEKFFESKPTGIWLPECAYRGRENGRKGIDNWLADAGIKYFFVEDIGIEQAEFIDNIYQEDHPTTYRGYKLESGVCVFGRNHATGKQVWSSESGYPGDQWYREFHIKDGESGLHYHRVTGNPNKEIYNPVKAMESIKNQAKHFVNLIQNNLSQKEDISNDTPPIIVSPYDCELYGHWWLEGVDWISEVYELLLNQQDFKVLPLDIYVDIYKESFSTIKMKPSTWGENSDFTVWNNPEHSWLWPYINSSRKDFENVLQLIKYTNRKINERDARILKQISRELLLLEGSDWPFLLHTKQAKEYANKRFHNHHQRFNKLIWAAKNLDEIERLSENDLVYFEDIDNPFNEIDYNSFRII